MIGIDVTVLNDGILQTFADLKNVKIAKVVRNAARDIVYGAYLATPRSTAKKSPYAEVPNQFHSGNVKIRLDPGGRKKPQPPSERERLSPYRLVVRRGWSKATWIGAMRALQMNQKTAAKLDEASKAMVQKKKPTTPPADLRSKVEDISTKPDSPMKEITNRVYFLSPKQSGVDERILQAGYDRAAAKIDTELHKLLDKALEGQS